MNVESLKKMPFSDRVTVDYTQSLPEMIKTCGCGYNQLEIKQTNFKINGSGQQVVDLVLVSGSDVLTRSISPGQDVACHGYVTTQQVLAYMESHGFIEAEAKIEHLLFFGAANPNKQKEFDIIALGSSIVNFKGIRYYPSLDRRGEKRQLRFRWPMSGLYWGSKQRFLAVCKAA